MSQYEITLSVSLGN